MCFLVGLCFVVCSPLLRVLLFDCDCLSDRLCLTIVRHCNLALQYDLDCVNVFASCLSKLEVRASASRQFMIEIDCIFLWS